MRWALLAGLAIICGYVIHPAADATGVPTTSRTTARDQESQPGQPADTSPILHSERGLFATITIEKQVDFQRPDFRDNNGDYVTSGRIVYNRLLVDGILWGSQIKEMDKNIFDIFAALAFNPWDNLVMASAVHAYDPRHEPLTYYHRSGPVGAIFHELRTRKGGADAKAPVAKLGLETGAVLCYALRGQLFTTFETDPAMIGLADSDTYFTSVADARRRGAFVEISLGDRRAKLKADKNQKYAVILVDQCELYPVPTDLMTKEAVQLYFDRLIDDGILALHISNKYIRLEPMIARMAADLKLTARVWSDDSYRRPGKTGSSWVVLARKPEHLGSLYSPVGDLMFAPQSKPGEDDRIRVSMDSQLYMGLLHDYESELAVGKPKAKYLELNEANDPRMAWIDWINTKLPLVTDPHLKARLILSSDLIRRFGPLGTYEDAMFNDHGHAFRRLETYKKVTAWTDDDSDVFILMMNKTVQNVRRSLGFPTPIER